MDDPILEKFLIEFGYITEDQIAALERVDVGTVSQRRSRGQMPNHRKIGRAIVYRTDEYTATVEDRIAVGGHHHQGPSLRSGRKRGTLCQAIHCPAVH